MAQKDLTEGKSCAPFWTLSLPFLVLMMIANAGLRAHGDGATSAAIMAHAAVIQIFSAIKGNTR